MSSTGVRPLRTSDDRTTDAIKDEEQRFIQSLKVTTVEYGAVGAVATGESGGSGAEKPTGRFLERGGDVMDGPIGFRPTEVTIVDNAGQPDDNTIDLRLDVGAYSTYVKALANPTPDSIVSLLGAQFDGQLLYLQGQAGASITLEEASDSGTGGNGGNILTGAGDNGLLIDGAVIITLMFDQKATVPTVGVQGAWRVVSGGASQEAAIAVLGRDVNQTLNAAGIATPIEYDDNFFLGDTTKITDEGGGVFKLLGGFFYRASSINAFQLTDVGQGTDVVGAWEVSLTNIPGNFVDILPGILDEEARIVMVASIGKVQFTVQPNAQAVVINASAQDVFIRMNCEIFSTGGTPNNWLFQASGAIIETVGLAGGGGGGGGSGDGHIITDATSSFAQRANLQFIGNGVTVSDDLGTNSTVVDIVQGGGEFFGPWTATHDAGNQQLDNLLALDVVDSAGASHLSISGPLGVGGLISFANGEILRFDQNITTILTMNNLGMTMGDSLDLTMGLAGNIVGGGAGEGLTNAGHIDFVNNLATPAATFSIFSNGTDLFANTGSKTVNLDNIPELSANQTWTGTNTFTQTIIAGGSALGMNNIGELSFVNNGQTPITPLTIWTDGTLFNFNADINMQIGSLTNVDALQIVTTGGLVKGSLSGDTNAGMLISTGLGIPFSIFEVLAPIADFQNDPIDGVKMNIFGDIDMNKDIGASGFIFEVDAIVFDTFGTGAADGKSISVDGSGGTVMNFTMERPTDIFRFNLKTGISNVIALEVAQNIVRIREAVTDFEIATFQNLLGINFNTPLTMNDNAIVSVANLIQLNNYHQMESIATPGTTGLASRGRIFMDQNNSNHLSIIRNSGIIDLEGGGAGSQTPWLSNIDADGFSLQDFGSLEFRDGAQPADTVPYISKQTVNLVYSSPGTDGHLFSSGGNQKFGIGTSISNFFTSLSMNANKITSVGDPTQNKDAANKEYVDSVAGSPGTQEAAVWESHETSEFNFEVYRTNSFVGGAGTTRSVIEDTAYYVPIFVAKRSRFVKLGIQYLGSTGVSTIAFALFDTHTDQNYPNNRLVNQTGFFGGGAGVNTVTVAVDVEAGFYWLAFVVTSSNNITAKSHLSGDSVSVGWLDNTFGELLPIIGYIDPQTGTTFPDPAPDNMLALDTIGPPALFAKMNFNPN